MEIRSQSPHRRWNPLRQSWVLVSPHRTQRPWQGEVGEKVAPCAVSYDPECYLCPGNRRAGGAVNPDYEGVFSFVNDYAALLPDALALPDPATPAEPAGSALLLAKPARGLCKVICYHPDHSLTLARMTLEQIRPVVDGWTEQYRELGALDWIEYVQIFENRGAMMGASNPHPHGQIWATGFIPDEAAAETEAQRQHLALTGRCLLCEYLAVERAVAGTVAESVGQKSRGDHGPQGQSRIVFENEHFVVLIPWWAVWPFEVMLVSRRHAGALPEFTSEERGALADALKRITTRFDNLFATSFPYTMGFHQAPTDRAQHPEWHFHAHFYPPLLRSATVRKFMVGFEMLGMPQRDITPEEAAQRLRAASEVHFRD